MLKCIDSQQRAGTNTVVRNKQSNVSCSKVWLTSSNEAQISPSAEQLNISIKLSDPKTDKRNRRPRTNEAYPTRVPRKITWSAVKPDGHCTNRCNAAADFTGVGADFTSDHLAQTGVIIFNNSLETSTPNHQTSHFALAPSASAEKGTLHRIGEMLRQIRRELGVREPCRADREARKQIREAAGAETLRRAGGSPESEGAPHVASAPSASPSAGPRPPYPDLAADPSGIAPGETSTAFKLGQEGPEMCKVSSGLTGDTTAPSNSDGAQSQSDAKICARVRIAHKPKRGLEAKQGGSTLSLKEVNNVLTRKRPEKVKDIPR